MKLTHDNIAEYRGRMVGTQGGGRQAEAQVEEEAMDQEEAATGEVEEMMEEKAVEAVAER